MSQQTLFEFADTTNNCISEEVEQELADKQRQKDLELKKKQEKEKSSVRKKGLLKRILEKDINTEELLTDLNTAQTDAVKHKDGPMLVLAGAGSGKTRTVTRRIAYLIYEHGVNPYSILAVTFTNKAAAEMRERVESILGESLKGMWISTFHSACLRILRMYIDRVGYENDFVIYDVDDTEKVIKQSMKALGIDKEKYKPRAIKSEISMAKAEQMDPAYYETVCEGDFEEKVAFVYKDYQKRLKANNALDFDDLIFLTAKLLDEDEEVLKRLQSKFKYIMIDEYQDTNFAQHNFAMQLSRAHKNLFVVGDDDQSIYEWRGAEIENIIEFEQNFPDDDVKIIDMITNYRSSDNILEVANSIICKNSYRKKVEFLQGILGPGEPVYLVEAYDEKKEAEFVARTVVELTYAEGVKASDIVVFYRTHSQSRVLEETFIKNAIPYKVFKGTSFYERMEIKDVLAYLKFVANPRDSVSLERIINLPRRGIGKKAFEKICIEAQRMNICAGELILRINQLPRITLPKALHRKIIDFGKLINEFPKFAEENTVYNLIMKILTDIDYYEYLRKTFEENYAERQENVKELLSTIADFEKSDALDDEGRTLKEFLSYLTLLTDMDKSDDEYMERVSLMTLHSSKGLEFDTVFLTGMEEGLFPTFSAFDDFKKLEEERRLAYVGVTRAKRQLFISYATQRMRFGKTLNLKSSRFVREIPVELLKMMIAR
ncbi:UvrD-helicase domain-containing protein [bacterium]|nr:UvrD-helicase domain-containing protein [bacterium]